MTGGLNVEEEVHDVTVLDDVVFAFDAHLAGGADGSFGLVLDEVFVLDDLGTDEAAFEVCVDDACGAGGLVACDDGPGTAFIGTGREEGPEAEEFVGTLDEADDSAFLRTYSGPRYLGGVSDHCPIWGVVYRP